MESLRERRNRKFLRKRLIKSVICLNVCIAMMIAYLPIAISFMNNILFKIITVLLVIILANFYVISYTIKESERIIEAESSKKFVKFFLSNEKWKEVEVKNAKEYEEFLNQLKKITKFYAIIDESKNSIIVNVVFDNKDIDTKKLYFEAISKEDFEKFYKIKK
jgi:hypothetical protein